MSFFFFFFLPPRVVVSWQQTGSGQVAPGCAFLVAVRGQGQCLDQRAGSTWTEETAGAKVLRQTKKLGKATRLFLIGTAPGAQPIWSWGWSSEPRGKFSPFNLTIPYLLSSPRWVLCPLLPDSKKKTMCIKKFSSARKLPLTALSPLSREVSPKAETTKSVARNGTIAAHAQCAGGS